MAITTVNISGYVTLPDGSDAEGAILEFVINQSDFDIIDNYVVPESSVFAVVQTGGYVEVDLWPNNRGRKGSYYTVHAKWLQQDTGKYKKAKLGTIQPVESGNRDISFLLSANVEEVESKILTYLIGEGESEIYQAVIDSSSAVIIAQEAADAAQEAADTATTLIGNVDARVDTLREEFDVEAAINTQRDATSEQVDEHLLELALAYNDTNQKIADAGIVVDPETGTVSIAGLANVEGRVNQVEIDLDAFEATLNLSATQAYVDSQIAAAQLPEASVAELEGTIARVDQVEIDLNAVEGAITLTSSGTLWDINDSEVGIEAISSSIELLQGELNLKASQSELDTLSSDLTDAQIQISALDGASIAQTVQETRELYEGLESQAELTLNDILDNYENREDIRQDIALARQDISARFTDEGEAVSRALLDIRAEVDKNTASIIQESEARASEDGVVVSQVLALEGRIEDTEGDITQLNNVDLSSSSALVQSLLSLEGRVEDTEGDITQLNNVDLSSTSALVQSLLSLEGRVEGTEGSIAQLNNVDVSSTSSLVQSLLSLDGRVGDTEGEITDLYDVNVSLDSALVQKILGISTTVNGNTTTVNETIESVDGIKGQWGIEIDNNGRISGINLLSDENQRSDLEFIADNFSISSPDGGITPFFVRTTEEVKANGDILPVGVYINNVYLDSASVVGTIKSDNFSTTEKTGWRIKQNGAATFYGPTLNVAPDKLQVETNLGTTTPFTVRESDETVGGVTYPAGVYLGNTYVESANVFGVLKSDNFVSGESGWRIKPDGSAEFNNVVVSRPLVIAEGTHTLPSPVLINSPTWQTWYESGLVNTGYFIDVQEVWLPADAIYKVEAAFNGSATGVNIGDGTQEYWEAKVDLVKAARWSGPQQFRLRLWIEGMCRPGGYLRLHQKGGPDTAGGEIQWKIYKVT